MQSLLARIFASSLDIVSIPIIDKHTMFIKINPKDPQERLIIKVVEVLKKGGIIAYPTDTYYGIGCDIMNKKAIEIIYKLKQRNKIKPFSFIC